MKNNALEKILKVCDSIPLQLKYAVCILIGLIIGALVFHNSDSVTLDNSHVKVSKNQTWTCSMHPQIQLPKSGKCPICAMDLIPLEVDTQDSDRPNRKIKLSKYAASLAEIEVHPVERKFVTKEIELFGEVDYDETRIAYITAWVSGRIDRLYINETGVPIRKGDHIAYLYSPELLSAQQEYLQSIKGDEKIKETHLDIIRSSSKETLKNAKDKLILLGITEEQIQDLEERKKAHEHITIFSSASGIVLKREVQEGDYVKTGQRLYSIADLKHLWMRLDAYESDLQWLRYGQEVVFYVEACPKKTFHGRISFISPVLDKATQTVKIRVAVENAKGKLKPGMFVRAVVKSEIAEGGQVVDAYMIDKWICPMHPSVIQNTKGNCPACDMALVSSEEMGYTQLSNVTPPLVIKASAVLKTGKRAVVYVQDMNAEEPLFEGREIVIGARAGDYYIVYSGLAKGDMVVTQGNFKLDSALQIQAKPSMMNPSLKKEKAEVNQHMPMEKEMSEAISMPHQAISKKFLKQLNSLYNVYFVLQESLAGDDLSLAQKALHQIEEQLQNIDMNLLEDDAHIKWMDLDRRLKKWIIIALETKNIDAMRSVPFKEIADTILEIEKYFGHIGTETYYEAFCPMAKNNKGSSWLQRTEPINNPFFGEMMLRCGEVKQTFAPSDTE